MISELFQKFVPIILVLLFLSQVIPPLFTKLPFFFLFRKGDPKIFDKKEERQDGASAKSLKDEVEEKSKEWTGVKQKVDANLKDAQELKDKTSI